MGVKKDEDIRTPNTRILWVSAESAACELVLNLRITESKKALVFRLEPS